MKNVNTIYVLFLVLTIGLASGCKKFVSLPAPGTMIERSIIFSDEQAVSSALAGLYSRLSQTNLEFANAGVTFYAGLSSDEIVYNGTSPSIIMFATNSLMADESTGIKDRLWNAMYRTIFHANSILEGLAASTTLNTSVSGQVKGECLVIRALHYFYLLNLYGDVPLLLGTSYLANQGSPRISTTEIYRQIEVDLLEAIRLLSESYPSANRGRISKMAATALLSRVYLYQQKWVEAENTSLQVIQANQYSLVQNLASVFLPASQETIWQLTRDNSNTASGINYVPASTTTRPTYVLSASLLQSFEIGDLRRSNWISKNTVSGQDYYYPYKYKLRTATPVGEYEVVFRLAEQYLICAEARANQNKLSGTNGAIASLNVIRQRAGLVPTSATTREEMLSAIYKERQTELFAEWGHRWLDLKRTNRASLILEPLKIPNWQSMDQLYPIPSYELQTNPFMTQNPGY